MADRVLTVTFIGNDAQLNAAFKRVGANLNTLQRSGDKLQSIGGSMTRNITLPLLAVGAASVKMASDFQSSTEHLRTQAGATQKQVDKLRQGMLDMAGAVGQTPQQLSAGMYHVVSSMNAVLPPSQRVSSELKILKTSAELASVGGANLEETSYALASAMNALHAPISQTTKIAGQMNAIVGAGDMTFNDLLESLKSGLLPAAKQVGLSFQSVGAALAVMGDMGMRGSLAGTRLRMAIALLSSPSMAAAKTLDQLGLSSKQAISTSEAMSKALQKAGVSTTQLGQDLKKPDGLAFALNDLNKHLQESGLTASGAAAVMTKAFGGGRMGAALTLLAQNTDRLRLKFDQIGQSSNNFNSAWKATTHTASFEFHSMLASVQADAIKLGNAILPIVLNVAHSITGVVHSITDAFTSLPKDLQSSIIKGGLILATLGPAMKVLGMFTTAIGRLSNLVTGRAGAEIFGGAAGGGGAAAGRAAGAAASTGIVSSIRSGLGTALSRGFTGVAVAGLGSLVANEVGTAIHGAAGQAVKSIGSDTAIGAGIGSLFGPAGAFGGALIGGIAGSVSYFIGHDAERQGDQWASKFTSHLGGHISAAAQRGLAQATTNAIQAPRPGSQQAQALAGNTHLILNPGQRANPELFNKAFNQQFNQLYNAVKAAGLKAGQTFVQAWQTVKFPSEPILLKQMDQVLNDVPRRIRQDGAGAVQEWKDQAAKQMLQYAVTLQQQGKLPISAVQGIMRGLERQIPGFSSYLSQQGITSDKAFAKALKFNQATATLKQTLLGYRKDFGDTSVAINLTADNINSNVSTAMKHLKTIISTSTGDTRKAAVNDFHQLRDQTTASFSAMGQKVGQTAKDMAQSIKNGSSSARHDAEVNFAKFQDAVYTAMSSGTLSTSSGMSLITKALNATLKALGVKQIPVTTINPHLPSAVKQKSTGGAARGALYQVGQAGQAGHDSVPLSVGGRNVMVAPGEQVAVFNRHQLPIVNAALAPMGGLPGLFQKVNKPHYMAKGGMVPGFATGGTLSYAQLEGLWEQGGGPPSVASIAAAIALAESGGRDVMQQGQPFATTGWGYWQITPGGTQYLDPLTNARAAVGKYHGAGDTFRPWTTYMDGAYRQFLKGGINAAATAFSQLAAPIVNGVTTVSDIVRSSLKHATSAANSFLARKTQSGVTGGGGAASISGLPSGLGTFQGLPVDNWIIPILQWASQHGWGGRITSGYRSPSQVVSNPQGLVAPQGHSNHSLTSYPGGAIDVGNPGDRADGSALWNVLQHYPGSPNLVWGGPVIGDWGHFSATGHARGGFLKGYAGGGIPAAPRLSTAMQAFVRRATSQRHKAAKKSKRPKGSTGARLSFQPRHIVGAGGPFPFDTGDISSGGQIAKILDAIYGLDGGDGNGIGAGTGGDAQKSWTLIDWFTNNVWPGEAAPNFSSIASPGDFIISQDALGNSITPYISPRLDTVIGELSQAIGWQTKGVGDLYQTKGLAALIQPAIRTAIQHRVAVIAKIRKRAQDDLSRIAQLQKKIADAKKKIADANKRLTAVKGAGPNTHQIAAWHAQISQERAKKKPNRALISSLYSKIANEELKGPNASRVKQLNEQIKGWDGQIAGWTSQITGLQAEALLLTGSKTSIGSGGELATIQGQLGATGAVGPIQAAENGVGSATGLYSLLNTVQGWGSTLGGTGGAIDQQNLILNTWKGNLLNLMPGAQTALTAAQAQAAASSTPDQTALIAALTTQANQAQFAASASSVELAQMASFLKESPPPAFGGSFAIGGVVPGLPGEPRTIIAHGGELISDGPGSRGSRSMNMGGLIEALGAHTEATNALNETVAIHNDHLERMGPGPRQAIRALADVINGEIGARAHSRATGSAGDGSVARYR